MRLYNDLFKAGFLASAMALGSTVAMAEPVEVEFWNSANNPGTTKVIEAFEAANPDIKIKNVQFGTEEYKTQLRVTVSGGHIPDVFTTNGGTTFFEYVNRGAAMDITDLVKQYKWDERTFPDFLKADSDSKGRIWGISWNTTQYWQGLFYDKDFFTQNNIKIPTTIDEFLETSKQIKAAGRFPIAFGDKTGWPAIIMLGDLMLQQVTPSEIQKLNTGEVKWTEMPAAKKAFEALHKLAAGGAFAPGFLSMDHEAAIMSWAGKRTALLYNGTWWPQVTKTNDVGFAIDVAPFPFIDKGMDLKGAQYWSSIEVLMSSKLEGAKKDAAIKFYDYLTSADGMAIYGTNRESPTTNPKANEKITDIAPFFKAAAFTRQDPLPKQQFFDHAFPIPVVEVLKVELQKVMQGGDVDASLAAVEAAHAPLRGAN